MRFGLPIPGKSYFQPFHFVRVALMAALFYVLNNVSGAEAPNADLSQFLNAEEWKLESAIEWPEAAEVSSPILVTRLKPLVAKAGFIGEYPPSISYHIHIFDENGAEVDMTPEGSRALAVYISRIPLKSVELGEQLSSRIPLAKYFAISPHHSYKVKVRRYLSLYPIPRVGQLEDGVRLEYVDAAPQQFQWK